MSRRSPLVRPNRLHRRTPNRRAPHRSRPPKAKTNRRRSRHRRPRAAIPRHRPPAATPLRHHPPAATPRPHHPLATPRRRLPPTTRRRRPRAATAHRRVPAHPGGLPAAAAHRGGYAPTAGVATAHLRAATRRRRPLAATAHLRGATRRRPPAVAYPTAARQLRRALRIRSPSGPVAVPGRPAGRMAPAGRGLARRLGHRHRHLPRLAASSGSSSEPSAMGSSSCSKPSAGWPPSVGRYGSPSRSDRPDSLRVCGSPA